MTQHKALRFLATASVVTLMMTAVPEAAAAGPQAPAQIEWDLSELYASYDDWTADRERLAAQIETLAEYRGRLAESAAVLREALDAVSTTERELYRLYVFAFLEADEDRRVAEAQERRGLGASLLSTFDEATSFLSPELLPRRLRDHRAVHCPGTGTRQACRRSAGYVAPGALYLVG